MSVQAGGETRCGIGTRLRAGREKKGFTILQAAEKLHVDAKILESLESEDFGALGAPVYVRGHLKHYAELVGEPAAQLLELYANSTRAAQPDLTRIPKFEPQSDPRRLTIPAMVVVGGFAIAGAVWWVLSISKGHFGSGAAKTAVNQSTPQSSGDGLPDTGTIPANTSQPVPAPVAPAVAPAANSAPPAKPSPDTPPRPPKAAELTLRFASESWAEVYDASGERLFYDVGAADSVKTFKGTPPLRVVLGNAPGVAVEVNGRAADLVSLIHTDGTAQFSVNRSGRTSELHQ